MQDSTGPAPKKRRFDLATVVRKTQLSPNMIRVTLKAPFIADLPESSIGGHVKLVVPPVGPELEEFRDAVEEGRFKQSLRTYTIRHIRPGRQEADIDFVAHGTEGIAGPWAMRAAPGDVIAMSRPGEAKLKKDGAARYLVATDMAAFPAAAAGLETLPADAKGEAWFEILSADDVQPLDAPVGIAVNWVVKSNPAEQSANLIRALKESPVNDDVRVFVAGEHAIAGELRDHFRHEKPVPKQLLYVSSYWKRGLIEQEHKMVKVAV